MLRVEGQPASLVVTPADVERGEVIVHGARLLAFSNERRGYRLRLDLGDPAFDAVELHGLPPQAPFALRAPQAVPVVVRLKLSPSAVPGEYRWPLRIGLSHP